MASVEVTSHLFGYCIRMGAPLYKAEQGLVPHNREDPFLTLELHEMVYQPINLHAPALPVENCLKKRKHVCGGRK